MCTALSCSERAAQSEHECERTNWVVACRLPGNATILTIVDPLNSRRSLTATVRVAEDAVNGRSGGEVGSGGSRSGGSRSGGSRSGGSRRVPCSVDLEVHERCLYQVLVLPHGGGRGERNLVQEHVIVEEVNDLGLPKGCQGVRTERRGDGVEGGGG